MLCSEHNQATASCDGVVRAHSLRLVVDRARETEGWRSTFERARSGFRRASASSKRALLDGRLRRGGPLALVIGMALWVVHPLWRQTPLSYDHSTHLFKAWHFWTEMVPRGRLRGWSHFWAFGFPSDELVPFGEELWVCLFRALSLGQLSWMRTYALAFAAFILLKAVTAYVFTRRYFGTTAGIAGAAIALLDPGSGLEGGWNWHTYFGVWPVQLSMCFLILAFVSLGAVIERGSARRIAWAAFWIAAGTLSHQLAPLVLVLTTPLLLLDHAYAQRLNTGGAVAERPLAGGPGHYVAALGALAFGAALSAFSVVPFVARSHHAQDLGWSSDSLAAVSHNLLTLRTFDNVWAPVHALALLGAWFAFRERRPGALFCVGSGALLVFLSSDTLIADLHLERALSSVLKIETDRMLVAAKLFWFALAGHGLAEALRRPRRALATARWQRWLAWSFALACSCALVAPGAREFYDTQIRKDFVGEKERRYWGDFKAFAEWSRGLAQTPGEFYRIAYHFPLNDHLSTLAPVFNGIPMYKVGSTPTQIFDKFPTSDEPELFEALGVKYVLSAYPLSRPDLDLERRFGELHWYRFNRFRPLPFTLLGEGSAELIEFEPERIRIRLSGISAGTRLKVHLASYDRWHATLDGEAIPITSVPVFGVEYPMLMELPVRDGELVIEYVYRTAEWLGLVLTLVSIAVFVGLARFGSRVATPGWALTLGRRAFRPALLGAGAGIVALVIVIAVRTRDRSRLLPKDSIFHELAGPELELDGQPCSRSEPLVFQCGNDLLRADVVAGFWGLHACMTAPSGERLSLSAELPLESFVLGRYDRPERSKGGKLRLGVNGSSLGSIKTRPPEQRLQFVQFDTRAFAGRAAKLELDLSGNALHCFDFRIVP